MMRTGPSRGAQLERILSAVEDRCAQLELGQRTFLLPEQFQQFAKLVKQRRESLYLTQLELSKRVGVCERTIKNIERREVSPSRDTVVRLLEVEELGLTWPDVLGEHRSQGPPQTSHQRSRYNCYIPRGYDSVRMVQQLVRMLSGPGGHVEQTFLSGAPECHRLSRDESRSGVYRTIPCDLSHSRRLCSACGVRQEIPRSR
jgi:transcriptional regulator with XRE-family HTH domain